MRCHWWNQRAGIRSGKKMPDNGAKHVTLTYFHDTARAKVEQELEKKYAEGRFYVLGLMHERLKAIFLPDRNARKNKLKINVGPVDCVDIMQVYLDQQTCTKNILLTYLKRLQQH